MDGFTGIDGLSQEDAKSLTLIGWFKSDRCKNLNPYSAVFIFVTMIQITAHKMIKNQPML